MHISWSCPETKIFREKWVSTAVTSDALALGTTRSTRAWYWPCKMITWWEHIVFLTHWGRVTHICVSKLTIIGSDNGLSPDRRQAITWTNAGLLFWTLRNKLQWNLNRNSKIFIQENAFECVVCETAAILSRPQCVNKLMTTAWHGNTFRISGHVWDHRRILLTNGQWVEALMYLKFHKFF